MIYLFAWSKEDIDHAQHSKLESSGDQQRKKTLERTENTGVDQSSPPSFGQDHLSSEGQPSQEGVPVQCTSEEEDELEPKQESDDGARKLSPLKPQETGTGSRLAQERERERDNTFVC